MYMKMSAVTIYIINRKKLDVYSKCFNVINDLFESMMGIFKV